MGEPSDGGGQIIQMNVGNDLNENEDSPPRQRSGNVQHDVENTRSTRAKCYCGGGCGDSTEQTDNYRDVLLLMLSMILFSPLKWKHSVCWISIPHLFWFGVHVTKIGFLTKLIFEIGFCRGQFCTIVDNRHLALKHILMEKWDASYETLPYPPAHGEFAVYSVDDLRSGINYTVAQFYNAEVQATGKFVRTPRDGITINIVYFKLIEDPMNKSEIVDIETNKHISFKPDLGLSNYTNQDGDTLFTYNVSADIVGKKLQCIFNSVFEVNLTFSLHAIRVNNERNDATCHNIQGNVTFHDIDQDGQVVQKLTTMFNRINCRAMGYFVDDFPACGDVLKVYSWIVGALTLITAIVDVVAFLLGLIVLALTYVHIEKHYEEIYKPFDKDETNIPMNEYIAHIHWCNLLSVLGDSFTLYGVTWITDQLYSLEDDTLFQWDKHVVFLGYGCIITWICVLRFVRINHRFSLLFKTIWKSAWDVLLFLICVSVLFFGFWTSTYIVLGPYHIKFQTRSSTAETLFSIINGDEIFATFAILQNEYSGDGEQIWLFSRIVIYVYVSLFTILVFNLLIALFNSAYEAVKVSYESQKPQEPTTTLIVSLRKCINSAIPIDNVFSGALRNFVESEGPLHHTEMETRKVLRKYLMLDRPDIDIVKRSRTLGFFICKYSGNEYRSCSHCCCFKSCSIVCRSFHFLFSCCKRRHAVPTPPSM